MKSMKSQQSGFTLVEIAIVLVIIGLLLGGILKGQELINSAKAKSFAQDFRTIQTALYGFQDRYKALPGDFSGTRLTGSIIGATSTTVTATASNGQIEGAWDSTSAGDESCLFWQHLRLSGFLAGPTVVDCTAGSDYLQKNADSGRIGISSTMNITGMTGSFNICSSGISGKLAKQLDSQLDDGTSTTGSLRIAKLTAPTVAYTPVLDADATVVCLAF